MKIKSFHDTGTETFTYVVSDDETRKCAIIDSVHNLDLASGCISNQSANDIIDYVQANELKVEWILDTHIHADHLTAAYYLKNKIGGKIGIGEHITKILSYWVPIFNTAHDTPLDASQYDKLFQDGEEFKIGNLKVRVLHTPGHTLDSISYLIDDAIFVGDTIFMPYVGTARTDFPGGSANEMYHSIRKILSLPGEIRIFTCHDYPPPGQMPGCESTVEEQNKSNVMINASITEEAYVTARNIKDENKPVPRLMYPSIQINLRAGALGDPESNGKQYIKIPTNSV